MGLLIPILLCGGVLFVTLTSFPHVLPYTAGGILAVLAATGAYYARQRARAAREEAEELAALRAQAASVGKPEPAAEPRVLECAKCGQKNRVRAPAGAARRPVCGRCRAPLEG